MSKSTPVEEFKKFVMREDFPLFSGLSKQNSFRGRIDAIADIYDFYVTNSWNGLCYSEVDSLYYKNSRLIFKLYDPVLNSECGAKGEVEVNVINKRMENTGKRTNMKVGRWLSVAYPFLTDQEKESISTWVKDRYTPLDAEFKTTEEKFGDIVTMKSGKGSSFDTTFWYKALNASCMRYNKRYFGLQTYHPYDAYCSGDFTLAYLEKDGLLYGRCLLHKDSKTHSAFYAVSRPAIELLKAKVEELGYTKVDCECEAWMGAKLLHLEDYHKPDDLDDFAGDVIVAPYLDFLEDEDGWSDGNYIYINHRPYDKMRRVQLQDAAGWNEL